MGIAIYRNSGEGGNSGTTSGCCFPVRVRGWIGLSRIARPRFHDGVPAALLDPNALPTLLVLIGLELVQGVDNVLVVALVAAGLPAARARVATTAGLAIAVVLRIAVLAGITALLRVDRPLVGPISAGDLVFVAGGLFLIGKAVSEIHRAAEPDADPVAARPPPQSLLRAVFQISCLDLVFSIDSVATAVGLTRHLLILALAVIASFGIVLFASRAVADFIQRNRSLKWLGLAFLICIGASLVLEGFHQRFPRAYLYVPLGCALALERWHAVRRRR